MMDFIAYSPASILRKTADLLLAGLPEQIKAGLSYWQPLEVVHVDQSFETQLTGLTISDGKGVHLLLDGTLSLKHSFEIPKTGARDIRRLVEIEAERIFPINVSRLTLAWRICVGNNQQRQMIEVFGIRKTTLEKVEALTRKLNVPLRKVSILDEDSADRVEVSVASLRSRNLVLKLSMAALMIAAFLIISRAPSLYLNRLNEKIVELDNSVKLTRRNTSAVTTLQRQMRSMQSLAAQVHRQRMRGQISDVLTQITQASPDDVVVMELRLDRERLYLSGLAMSPEIWVIAFAAHKAFEDVSLTSVTQGSEGRLQRFEMRATVRWPDERREE